MKIKFTLLLDVDKVKGGREISFNWEIDGVSDNELYNMWCKRHDEGGNEYDVWVGIDEKIYRDMAKYKEKIDNWWIGEERGIEVFEKVDKKIKEECRFSIWDNGFWEEIYRDYRNKVIEI